MQVRTVKDGYFSTLWCVECDSRIHSEYGKGGVCPHCGNVSPGRGTVDVYAKVYRRLKTQVKLILWWTVRTHGEFVRSTKGQ